MSLQIETVFGALPFGGALFDVGGWCSYPAGCIFLDVCTKKAMNDTFLDIVLTNYEDLNVYNELVHKKWR